MIVDVVAVGCGGFIGAILRFLSYKMIHSLHEGSFPYATIYINVLGCFFMGVLSLFFENDQFIQNNSVRYFLVAGLLGSFTTFSTFGLEGFRLMKNNQMTSAFIYIVCSVVLGFIALTIGRIVARQF